MDRRRINIVYPPNVGWLQYKLSDKEMDYVWRCIENKKENCNSNLAGNITNSYTLFDRSDWFFLNVLKDLCFEYSKNFKNLGKTLPVNQGHPYFLHSWWVNYQRQGEFNPMHDHNGVYSFVIWMKIPTEFEDQKKIPIAANSNSQSISNFQFLYPNILGLLDSYQYTMKAELEGTLLFFPSNLHHQVYPFYNCDEERVSVSGNIRINTTKRL